MDIFTPNVNVKFNSILDNAVILKESLTEKTVILWDGLSFVDQQLLNQIVVTIASGSASYTTPSAGRLVLEFSQDVTATTPTGLESGGGGGKATVLFTSDRTLSTPSGLTNNTPDFVYASSLDADGDNYKLVADSVNSSTIGDLINTLNATLSTSGVTVQLLRGAIQFDSITHSQLRISEGVNAIFASLTDFQEIVYFDGAPGHVYTADLVISGVTHQLSVNGSDAQTWLDLMTNITNQAPVLMDGLGSIVVAMDIVGSGPSSTVILENDNLFRFVNNYSGKISYPGADSLFDALKTYQAPNGTPALQYFPHLTVGIDRPLRPIAGTVPKHIKHIYFGGTPADWRYLNDDSVV